MSVFGSRRAILSGGASRIPLVRVNWMASSIQFSRASGAVLFDASGNVVEVGNHIPRFNNYTPMGIASSVLRLLIEEQRTNIITNPRAEGTAGSVPTLWGSVLATGMTAVLSFTTLMNFNALRTRISGQASGTIASWPWATASGGGATVPSRRTVTSAFLRMQDSTILYNGNTQFRGSYRNSSDIAVSATPTINTNITQPTSTLARQYGVQLGSADAATAKLQTTLVAGVTTGNNYDFTLDQMLPQVEVDLTRDLYFPTSPILPAVGNPQFSSRAADRVAVSSSLVNRGGGMVLGKAMLPYLPATGTTATLFSITDDSSSNQFIVAVNSSGQLTVTTVVNGGAAVSATASGSVIAGTAFRFAAVWNGSTYRITLNGGSVAAVSNSALAGTLRMDIGAVSTVGVASSVLNGEIEFLDIARTGSVGDTSLQALCNSIP